MPEVEVSDRRYDVCTLAQGGMGLLGHEIFVRSPISWAVKAGGLYEGWVQFDGVSRKMYVFCMRSMASGGAFHRAYPHATSRRFWSDDWHLPSFPECSSLAVRHLRVR